MLICFLQLFNLSTSSYRKRIFCPFFDQCWPFQDIWPLETDSGTEKKKKVHLTDFNSGWCFSFNVQAGQVGHVENSVGQGQTVLDKLDMKNTVLDKGTLRTQCWTRGRQCWTSWT